MKYVHTNIVADDWKRLAKFYQDVLGCVPVPPERNLKGEWVDKLTGLTDAHITGVHLRLPGWGDDGPTLEIFQYNKSNQRLPIATNNPGFGHIAFQVDDVEEAVAAFLANGGSPVGELLVHQYPDGRYLTVRYVADPEGNVVELQSWSESRDKFSLLTDCIRIAEVQFSRINLKKVVSERRLFCCLSFHICTLCTFVQMCSTFCAI